MFLRLESKLFFIPAMTLSSNLEGAEQYLIVLICIMLVAAVGSGEGMLLAFGSLSHNLLNLMMI